MIDCTECDGLLDELLDGGLTAAAAARVEAHLAGCPSCRAVLADLRTLREVARAAPASVPPPEGLWSGIAARRPVGVRRLVTLPAWALAAAAAMLVAVGGAGGLWLRSHPAPPSASTAALPAELAELEQAYLEAAAELARALEARRGELLPDGLAALERSLAVVDEAIAEARAAATRAPASTGPLLLAAHERKLALLRQAARLLTAG